MMAHSSKHDMAATCKFLTLPTEIRNIILEHCLDESSVSCYHEKHEVDGYRGNTRVELDVSTFRLRYLRVTSHHILATCRQLRAEALPIYLQQTKFAYELELRTQTYHLETVLALLRRTLLIQVRKLAFPEYKYDEFLVSAFPNLQYVEFGEAKLRAAEDEFSGGLIVEKRKIPWSALQLVDAAKDCLEDCIRAWSPSRAVQSVLSRKRHMQWLVEMPDRQFRVTCYAMMAVPVSEKGEKGEKDKCIMVELCFDWDSGKLLRVPLTKAAEGLGHILQYSEGDMLSGPWRKPVLYGVRKPGRFETWLETFLGPLE